VAPGVWAIKQPLRNAMRFVWAYAIEADDGVVLVDAGLDDDVHYANLESALGTFGATFDDVRAAIFTHFHGDHYGLAGRIRDRSGAWIALHETEAELMESLADVPIDRADIDHWFGALGVPEEERPELVEIVVVHEQRLRSGVPPDQRLRDGDVVETSGERFTIMHTPGHSPGHVCVLQTERGVVFSGDHVLSETTPNVSIFPSVGGNPLDAYLGALDRVRALDGYLALPGHEESPHLGARATELIAYHTEQLAEVERIVAEGLDTARQIGEALWSNSWRVLSPIDRHLALGETLAHVVVLEERGVIDRVSQEPMRWQTRAA
jgi:glyoxylase-like metal-dependent hydrolase (beta-lactamase superfamily II)